MKKAILLSILILLASCGPHRMKCGPRGICKLHHHIKPTVSKKNDFVSYNRR